MKNSALLVIDVQKFFFEENKRVDALELAKNCNVAIRNARKAGTPIFHIVTEYRKDQKDWPEEWKGNSSAWCSSLVNNHPLTEIVEGIVIEPEDMVVKKKRFSAFYHTDLDDLLRGLGVTHVYAVGYASDVCVRFTLVDAYNRGYQTSIIEDCVEAFHESKEASLEYLAYFINTKRLITSNMSLSSTK